MENLSQKYRSDWYRNFDSFHKLLQEALDKAIEDTLDFYPEINCENFCSRYSVEKSELYTFIEANKNTDIGRKIIAKAIGKKPNTMLHEETFKKYFKSEMPDWKITKGNKYCLTESCLIRTNDKDVIDRSKTIDFIITSPTKQKYYLTLKHGTWYCGGGQDNQRQDIIHTLSLSKNNIENIFAVCDGDYYNHEKTKGYKNYIEDLKTIFPNQVFTTEELISFLKTTK